jgi:hypothetical protein
MSIQKHVCVFTGLFETHRSGHKSPWYVIACTPWALAFTPEQSMKMIKDTTTMYSTHAGSNVIAATTFNSGTALRRCTEYYAELRFSRLFNKATNTSYAPEAALHNQLARHEPLKKQRV